MEAWPGNSTVVTSDASNAFGSNLSGLTYESAVGVLWAVQNNPSKIFRLVHSGSIWTHSTSNGWSAGKTGTPYATARSSAARCTELASPSARLQVTSAALTSGTRPLSVKSAFSASASMPRATPSVLAAATCVSARAMSPPLGSEAPLLESMSDAP